MNSNNPVVSNEIKNYSHTQNSFISKSVTIPLIQEYGSSYRVLVKPGDIVQEGEKIAVSEGTSVYPTYIHSSLPGKVTEISSCILQNGKQEFAVKIKFGGSFKFLGKKINEADTSVLSSSGIVEALLDKGVMNTFDISEPKSLGTQIRKLKKCGCIAVRMFDEDPHRITDSLVAKFYFEKIIKASKVIAKALNASGIVLAIDQKMQNKNTLKNYEEDNLKFLEMNIKRYPCGTPREMVSAFSRSALKKTCSFSLSKTDLFIDASSMLEVYNAVILNSPAISRHVHFSGNCLYSSCMLNVKIGTPIKDIVAQLGGFSKIPSLIIINGELGGASAQNLDLPITKDIKSIKFVSTRRYTDEQVYSCINCGNCRYICPVKIAPDILYNSVVNAEPLTDLMEKSTLICNSCGLCSTVCQSRLPLAKTISLLKEHILNNQKEQVK